MSKQLITITFLTSICMSLPALANETNEMKEKDYRAKESGNISSNKSSRGSVTQGVIGAEADENKKLVPASSPDETEKDTDPNIRLQDNIIEDLEFSPEDSE